jgi:GH35 family endo-1,4-beta-xylanase
MSNKQIRRSNKAGGRIWAILLITSTIFLICQSQAQIQTDVPALKDVYAHDFYIGCLLSYAHIGFADDPYVPGQSAVVDPNGGYLIQYHMDSMSPGNNMKPQYTVDITASAAAYSAASAADKDSVDVHPVIRFNGNLIAQLEWAWRQEFTFRGHTLVWHSQTPGTAFFRTGYSASGSRLTKEKMTQRMDNYIKEVIRLLHESWPGLLSAMDVVNEAVNGDGSDRSSDSEWYLTFGDNTYIMKAFEITRKYTVQYGETQIKLYYNDYSTHVPSKADGIVRVCTPIFQAGYLDGIGMQEHDAMTSPTAAQWIATYDKFDSICTEMAVTELDVNTNSNTNYPSEAVLATQANQYAQLFKCFVERSYFSGRGKIINVSKDGLNDEYTFVKNQSSSLWNTQNQCKPAFYAVVNVGNYYNSLDSLIAYADTLPGSEYTPESWSDLTTMLNAAKSAMTQNYSSTLPADVALGQARDNLLAAINNLVKIADYISATTINQPLTFNLGQNYPNPFNPLTSINYSVPRASHVLLKVYNLLGEEIAILVDEIRPPGNYVALFDGSQLSSGVYIYSLSSSGLTATRKLTLLK